MSSYQKMFSHAGFSPDVSPTAAKFHDISRFITQATALLTDLSIYLPLDLHSRSRVWSSSNCDLVIQRAWQALRPEMISVSRQLALVHFRTLVTLRRV